MTLRPISIGPIVLCVVSACWPLLGAVARRRQAAGARSGGALRCDRRHRDRGALYALFHYVLLVALPTGVWGC